MIAVVTPFCEEGVMSWLQVKAGRDQFAPGVDLFLAFAQNLADLGDAAARNSDVGFVQFAAIAIGNSSAADHEVRGGGHGGSSRL